MTLITRLRMTARRFDRRGAALIEFALLAPMLTCLIFGMLSYGQYFLLAHLVQQLANDAARATVAGLNASERTTLATQSVTSEVAALNTLDATRVSTATSETNGFVTVTVQYDARHIAILNTTLVPLPDPVIRRRAIVRPGGIA